MDRKQTLREQLAAGRARVLAIAARLGPDDWERAVQAEDGRWTARQLFAHLLGAETGQLKLIDGIVAGGSGVADDFDLNRWNGRQVERNAERTPAELLAGLQQSRLALLERLDTLDDAALDRAGRHGMGRVMTVEQIFAQVAGHEQEHSAQIEAALGMTA